MDLYDKTSTLISKLLTHQYSTSFSSASRLFPKDMQPHIYNIYGLVRIADEVVDVYSGRDQGELLNALEKECYAAIERHYSTNPVVHAFALTAAEFGIEADLIRPFFESMRMDISCRTYDAAAYKTYIYGSAEAVGLMCLKVFCIGDSKKYEVLAPGAQRLGSAYQKVNFLRDVAADYTQLQRFYFPGMTYQTFDEAAKQAVVADIRADFEAAAPYILALPKAARPAVKMSYRYYTSLLDKLEKTDVAVIKSSRIRLPGHQKAILLATQLLGVKS